MIKKIQNMHFIPLRCGFKHTLNYTVDFVEGYIFNYIHKLLIEVHQSINN